MKIVTIPNPVLTTVASPVAPGTSLKEEFAGMAQIVKEHKALGIAAPQVGISKRFFVMKPGTIMWYIINPVIHESHGSEVWEEGCLSIPGVRIKVSRPTSISVSFFDENWNHFKKDVTGTFARVFQHELDHLDGKLITDAV